MRGRSPDMQKRVSQAFLAMTGPADITRRNGEAKPLRPGPAVAAKAVPGPIAPQIPDGAGLSGCGADPVVDDTFPAL